MELESCCVLLVEGNGDKEVIEKILSERNIPCPRIEAGGSVEKAFHSFEIYIKNPRQYRTVGLIVDADLHPDGRWQRFVQILNRADRYPKLEGSMLPHDGVIIEPKDQEDSKVGLWVMPDNMSHGMLESFLSEIAVTTQPELIDEAENALARLEEKGIQGYSPAHREKAKIHTYLAWQAQPGSSLSMAITKHYLNASAESASPFTDWVLRLFTQ